MSLVQPTFVLVGAPGTDKSRIANELAADHFTEHLNVHEMMFGLPSAGLALDRLADYRAEILLASQRATVIHSVERPTLYTHSLLDSLAYSLLRVEIQQESGVGSETDRASWVLTMALISDMVRDTFKSEEIFYLGADFDPEKQAGQFTVQDTLGILLDGFNLNYTIIDADSQLAANDISRIIKPYIRTLN